MAKTLQLLPSHTFAQVQVQTFLWFVSVPQQSPTSLPEACLRISSNWTGSAGLVTNVSGLGPGLGWFPQMSHWGSRPEISKVWSVTETVPKPSFTHEDIV